jgi:hypothetical protein
VADIPSPQASNPSFQHAQDRTVLDRLSNPLSRPISPGSATVFYRKYLVRLFSNSPSPVNLGVLLPQGPCDSANPGEKAYPLAVMDSSTIIYAVAEFVEVGHRHASRGADSRQGKSHEDDEQCCE